MSPIREITQLQRDAYARCWNALGEKNWRAFIIGIDGWTDTGKSSMGRFLAWQMGMPCIETDLFLVELWKEYEWERLRSTINSRLERNRPVIVEGVGLLRTLETIGLEVGFLIYMHKEDRDVCDSDTFLEWMAEYDARCKPQDRVHLHVRWREG